MCNPLKWSEIWLHSHGQSTWLDTHKPVKFSSPKLRIFFFKVNIILFQSTYYMRLNIKEHQWILTQFCIDNLWFKLCQNVFVGWSWRRITKTYSVMVNNQTSISLSNMWQMTSCTETLLHWKKIRQLMQKYETKCRQYGGLFLSRSLQTLIYI